MWQLISYRSSVTERLGEELGKLLIPGDVISLVGELGAGKTVFVHGIARGLGVDSPVSSPSFMIIHEYVGKHPIFHCDFFRLESYQELEDIGWEEYLKREGIIVIEWANRIPQALPEEYLEVTFSPVIHCESARRIQFYPVGRRYEVKVRELAGKCEYLE